MENNSRSRLYASFHIAGFQYWDGALVLDRLKVGKALELVPEPGNPYDPDAVALYYEGSKLGFVPRELNGNLAQLLAFGHTGVFEARVQQVAPERSPWHQVRVCLYSIEAEHNSHGKLSTARIEN